MKTIVGKTRLFAAAILVAPVGLSATAPSVLNAASRDTGRLTLLPGPNLTSPASAPQSGPTITIYPASQVKLGESQWRFVPGDVKPSTRTTLPNGTLTLSSKDANEVVAPPSDGQKKAPSADSLRFDSTLHPPTTPPQMQFIPAPKRD
jgi:hypothetical protein